jgi:hypothetical protein
MNKIISKILFNFLTTKRRPTYTFTNYYDNLKFVDLVSYNFNYVINDISFDQINKLTNYNESYNYINRNFSNKILTFDVNFVSSSKNSKANDYIQKLSKYYNCKYFSDFSIYNKSSKNNILNLDLYVKNFEYRNILENLIENMSEKIKQR